MFNIRLALSEDIKKIFDLSNDITVRENSINTELIKWENHILWFEKRIKKTDEPFFVVEDEYKNFIAQVRFDKQEDFYTISISIEKNFRGKGFASKIIRETSDIFNKRPIFSYIKVENEASKKSFLKAGYIFKEQVKINNNIYGKYILN